MPPSHYRAASARAGAFGLLLAAVGLLALARPAPAQDRGDWLVVDGEPLWISGGNVAWVHFGRDVGPGPTELDRFDAMFAELRAAGGNTFRLWLHTHGASTPAWRDGTVAGPGDGTIDDLRAILDRAAAHDVRLMLCLWSFDMLRISNGTDVTDRNLALLTDERILGDYIDRSLVPMVEALRGHPAILAWEIFNEPEGMSETFGWPFNRHVPMAAIQRFINRTAGAIKRTDPDVLVTNGSWSFRAASDVTSGRELLVDTLAAAHLDSARFAQVRDAFTRRYGYAFAPEEAAAAYDTVRAWAPNRNYYTDERLVAAGGDADGTLDFYTVHYYTWGSTLLSPFHHDARFWGLDKPLVVAEFYFDPAFGAAPETLYETLYHHGYAGALGWQWYDAHRARPGLEHHWPAALANMRRLRAAHPEAVAPPPIAPPDTRSPTP